MGESDAIIKARNLVLSIAAGVSLMAPPYISSELLSKFTKSLPSIDFSQGPKPNKLKFHA
jgi:hypothetical protein